MDDLISKSAVFEAIEDSGLLDTISQPEADLLEETIKNIKVAYNVDKVVEQLDKNAQKMSEAKAIRPYAKCSPADHRYYKAISVKKAKEIVEAGGVNE